MRREVWEDNAIVLYAGYYAFKPGEKIVHTAVESRSLQWCKNGRGMVMVEGRTCRFTAGDFVVLPMPHAVKYTADRDDPFTLGGIHIVPNYSRKAEAVFWVPHSKDDPHFGRPTRRDAVIEGLPDYLYGLFSLTPGLRHLAEFAAMSFERMRADVELARVTGQLLLREFVHAAKTFGAVQRGIPRRLHEAMQWVLGNTGQRIGVEDLAEVVGCSASTITREFKRHMHVTPIQWIIQTKIEQAARLLATTHLAVEEVGRQVGIEDPYYFSKLFRKIRGITATEHRKRYGRMAQPGKERGVRPKGKMDEVSGVTH
jgi:AraC-like DNA-binding protein